MKALLIGALVFFIAAILLFLSAAKKGNVE